MTSSAVVPSWLLAQPDALAEVFGVMQRREDVVREYSRQEQDHAVSEWLFALNVLEAAFAPDRTYVAVAAPEEDRVAHRAFELRLHFVALAGRASKPSLELLLSGYYAETWLLLRTMLEGWARCVYVRLRPEEFVRWFAADDPAAPDTPPRREPNWSEIAGVIRQHGAESDRALFEDALVRWELLTTSVQPSGDGLGHDLDGDHRIVVFQPEYDARLCGLTLSQGIFAHHILLGELARLGLHPQEWLAWNARFAAIADPLLDAAHADMEAWIAARNERRARRVQRRE